MRRTGHRRDMPYCRVPACVLYKESHEKSTQRLLVVEMIYCLDDGRGQGRKSVRGLIVFSKALVVLGFHSCIVNYIQ